MSFDATVGVNKTCFIITDGTNEVTVYAKPGITLRQFVEMDTLSQAQAIEFFAMHIIEKFVVNGETFEGEDKYDLDTRITTDAMVEYGRLGEGQKRLSKA